MEQVSTPAIAETLTTLRTAASGAQHAPVGARRGRGKPSKAQLAKEKKAAEKAKKIAAVPSQVPHTVKSSNSFNWSAFEAAELQKLSDTVLVMEKNKWRTGEAPLNKRGGGVF